MPCPGGRERGGVCCWGGEHGGAPSPDLPGNPWPRGARSLAGRAGEQVALGHPGRAAALGQAAQRGVGHRPVPAAPAAAAAGERGPRQHPARCVGHVGWGRLGPWGEARGARQGSGGAGQGGGREARPLGRGGVSRGRGREVGPLGRGGAGQGGGRGLGPWGRGGASSPCSRSLAVQRTRAPSPAPAFSARPRGPGAACVSPRRAASWRRATAAPSPAAKPPPWRPAWPRVSRSLAGWGRELAGRGWARRNPGAGPLLRHSRVGVRGSPGLGGCAGVRSCEGPGFAPPSP